MSAAQPGSRGATGRRDGVAAVKREMSMPDSAVQRFYRYHAYIYDATRWAILHGRRRAVQRLNPRPNASVLEIGCGTGLNFHYVLERLDASRGGRLVGLDFSADMLRRARRRVAARRWSNVELVQADAARIALDARFDGVLFAYSLTMIRDWRGALDRAREHLRPHGRIVVLDFGRFDGWGPLAPLMRGWLRLNHVNTTEPYEQGFRERFANARVDSWLGGYNFTAVGEQAEM